METVAETTVVMLVAGVAKAVEAGRVAAPLAALKAVGARKVGSGVARWVEATVEAALGVAKVVVVPGVEVVATTAEAARAVAVLAERKAAEAVLAMEEGTLEAATEMVVVAVVMASRAAWLVVDGAVAMAAMSAEPTEAASEELMVAVTVEVERVQAELVA